MTESKDGPKRVFVLRANEPFPLDLSSNGWRRVSTTIDDYETTIVYEPNGRYPKTKG